MNSKDFTHEKKTIAIIALLLITSNIFSQTTNKLLDSSTVKHQFESLIDKSNNFQGYKVIKTTSLFKLQSNVLDSLQTASANADFLNSQNNLLTVYRLNQLPQNGCFDLISEKTVFHYLDFNLKKRFLKHYFS
jgi:hypothetical protein